MSECERISDLFGEVHDNQADGKIEQYVRDHLLDCPGCRESFKWYGYTVTALNGLDRISPPPDFLARLNTKLETSPSFFDFIRSLFAAVPRVPVPVGVSALALIVVLSIALYNNVPQVPISGTSTALEQTTPSPVAEARMAARDTRGLRAKSLASSTVHPMYALQARPEIESVAHRFPTVADRIGADNLTVESPSVDRAVESLKRILPDLQGRLVDEKIQQNMGDKILAVLIPSESYGHLTTELINHGAVAAGSADISHAPSKKEGNNVLLYIRFVHTR
ncbi:MAG TPA: hypothetical protein VK463_20995 [Desulfomonilaceae bacterium]|nr:hypothetical protein [Desulfomonilaceae bacterium]